MSGKGRETYGLIACAATLGLVSVIYDALGSHFLNLPAKQADSLNVATHYGIVHAVLIIGLALMRFTDISDKAVKKLFAAGIIFFIGAMIFSFSIYTAILTGITEVTAITPLGGLTLMGGWLFLLWVAVSCGKRGST